MKVSVIIPCFNAAEFIAEAIQSVFRQTRPADEVLVVDDGSTDDSAAVARRHGARVIATPRNSGESAARNLGARTASGDVIAWLDADDIWTDDHLARVVPLLEEFPEAVLAFSLSRLFGARTGNWPAYLPEHQAVDAFPQALRRCLLPHNTVVIRRQALLEVGGYDESIRVGADYELWMRLARFHRFVCTHAMTCHWRHHDRNLGGNLMEYQRSEYRTRWRLWQSVVEGAPLRYHAERPVGNDAERAELAMRMREIWEEHLLVAWHLRDRAQMKFHLSMHALVPGSEAAYASWRRKLRLLPIAAVYDRLRQGRERVGASEAAP